MILQDSCSYRVTMCHGVHARTYPLLSASQEESPPPDLIMLWNGEIGNVCRLSHSLWNFAVVGADNSFPQELFLSIPSNKI
jgi:hypothetical protein